MNESDKPYLEGYNISRAKDCAYNIQDKLNAITNELEQEKPYKGYLKEKLESILHDTECLLSMSEREEK